MLRNHSYDKRLVKPSTISKRIPVFAAVLMLLLFVHATPEVHATLYAVTIFVHDEVGKPIPKSTVTVDSYQLSFTPIQWFDANPKGFVVRNLEAGTYSIWADTTIDGKKYRSRKIRVVIDSERAVDLEIKTGAATMATNLWLQCATTEIQVNRETSLHFFLGPITGEATGVTVTGCGVYAQRTTAESPATFRVKPTSTGSITVIAERAGRTSSLLIAVSGSAPGFGFAAFNIAKLLWRWTPIAACLLGLVAFTLFVAAYSLIKSRLEGKAR
jgi:hypothetical protein